MNLSFDVVLLIIMVVGVFYLRHENRKEYAALTEDLKIAAQNGLNRFRIAQFAVLLVALGAVIWITRDSKLDQTTQTIVVGVALLVMTLWAGPGLVLLWRRMKDMGFPGSYTRVYVLDRLFPTVLLGGLLVWVLWRAYRG